MKILLSLFALITLIQAPKAQAEPNMVMCWLFSLQGCPGVEPVGGKAITTGNNGVSGIGAIGGKTSKVETRTIIKVPDYKVRRFLRSLGLGGQRINISYEPDESECDHSEESLKITSNALFEPNNGRECMLALEEDLKRLPQGIHLQVTKCQERFCNEDFIEVFEAFLQDHPQFKISDSKSFLGCGARVVEI